MTREFDKSVEEALDDLKGDAYKKRNERKNAPNQHHTANGSSEIKSNAHPPSVWDIVPSNSSIDSEFLLNTIDSVISDNYAVHSISSGLLLSEGMDRQQGFIVKIQYIGSESDTINGSELNSALGVKDVNMHFDCDCIHCTTT